MPHVVVHGSAMMQRPDTHCWPAAHGFSASQAWMQLPPSPRQTRTACFAHRLSSRPLMNALWHTSRVLTHAARGVR